MAVLPLRVVAVFAARFRIRRLLGGIFERAAQRPIRAQVVQGY